MYLIFNDLDADTEVASCTTLCCSGLALARIIKRNGVEEHIHFKMSSTDPNIYNVWNPSELTEVERITYVNILRMRQLRNQQIAALLNVPISTVCADHKRIICNNI